MSKYTSPIHFTSDIDAPIHTQLVNEDGIIEDAAIETFYTPLEAIEAADGWLRVFADNDATNVETRIPFSALEALGWIRNNTNK